MPGLASAAGLPSVLGAMPTAVAVSVLCAAVIIEIVETPEIRAIRTKSFRDNKSFRDHGAIRRQSDYLE
jgi:hypothetical protein